MATGSLMFTLLVHFVQSFVFNDSKDSLKKQTNKKTTQPVCTVYMLKNG